MVLLAINTTIVTTGIVVFLIVILILVGILLFAKAKLTAKGDVKISINNGDRVITTEPGSSLLSTLAGQKIFLPSACGGKGSCGMCKCQVDSGAGSILPTETGFFSYKQQHENWRLACQVKVKENIEMRIPESVMGIKKWECTVVSNRNISTFLKEFVVKLPEGENLKFKSGGYIQIDVPALDNFIPVLSEIEKKHYPDRIAIMQETHYFSLYCIDFVAAHDQKTYKRLGRTGRIAAEYLSRQLTDFLRELYDSGQTVSSWMIPLSPLKNNECITPKVSDSQLQAGYLYQFHRMYGY